MDKVFESLTASAVRNAVGKVEKERFLVDGEELCINAYVLCMGISRRSLDRVRRRIKLGAERRVDKDTEDLELQHELRRAPSFQHTKRSSKAQVVIDWFNRVKSDGTCEKMPTGGIDTGEYAFILPYFSKDDTYTEWRTEMQALRDIFQQDSQLAKKAHFMATWRTNFPDVKPCSGAGRQNFASCNTCASARAQLRNVLDAVDLRIVRRKRTMHLLRQKLERKFYEARKFNGRVLNPNFCLSMIADCMEYKKCGVVRRKGRQSKDTDQMVLPQSLQTVLVHGRGVFNFSSHPHVNGGGGVNYTLECLMRTLHYLKADDSNPNWRVLYLQLDNCSGSNKNKYMLAWAQALVDTGVFDEVVLSFLMVGHTHEDIDQIFSVISKGLKKRDVVTPEDFEQVVRTTLTVAGHKYVHFELLDYQHDYKVWLTPKVSKHLKFYAKPHVFCFVKDADGVTRMRYKHWHRCFTWYPKPTEVAGGQVIHLPDVEDEKAQLFDNEDPGATSGGPRMSSTMSDEVPGFRKLEEYCEDTADTGRKKRRRITSSSTSDESKSTDAAPSQGGCTTEVNTAFQRQSIGVDLDAEVAAAIGESCERPTNLPIGGSFYSNEQYNVREQESFRVATGIVVMDTPVTIDDAPERQLFLLDNRCPYGVSMKSTHDTRYKSWVKKVKKILRGRTVRVTDIHREQWFQWFQKMEDIVWERTTADTASNWTWKWPVIAVPSNGGSGVGRSTRVPSDTLNESITVRERFVGECSSTSASMLDCSNILEGVDDSDDGGQVVRHSMDKITGREIRIGRENRMACEPTDLKAGSFIFSARDILKPDEYADVDGYTEKEARLPILLCRVEQDTPAHDDNISVEYWRQGNGNANGKFTPFLNSSRKHIKGVVDRATVLCTFARLGAGGKIPATVKKRLGEYNSKGRGKSLILKLPFVYVSGNGGKLVHTMDDEGKPGAILGFEQYMEGHAARRRRALQLQREGDETMRRDASARKHKRQQCVDAGLIDEGVKEASSSTEDSSGPRLSSTSDEERQGTSDCDTDSE